MGVLKATSKFLRKNLDPNIRYSIDKFRTKVLGPKLSNIFPDDLEKLALLNGSDKAIGHSYVQHYQRYFKSLKQDKLNILEIGVGGKDKPDVGGASLRMWKAYFPNSMIYGIDIFDKQQLQEERIKIFQGSQDDASFLEKVAANIGQIDIIIDDGSHINKHVIKTFQTLFPLLKSNGGIYVVEDTQTSYWPEYGGNSDDLNSSQTSMSMLKNLVDGINYHEFTKPEYSPSYFDKTIVSMHFYHNMVFIFKGDNSEADTPIRLEAT